MNEKNEILKKKFHDIYKYFSHNLRTSTSTIVALLEAIKDGLTEEADGTIELVHEAGFLLDIFDKALSTCTNFVVKDTVTGPEDEINVKSLVEHFFNKVMLYESVTINIPDDLVVKDKGFVFRNLFMVMIHESLKSSNGEFEINGNDKEISFFCKDLFDGYLDICCLFKEILNDINIEMTYTETTITLRFN